MNDLPDIDIDLPANSGALHGLQFVYAVVGEDDRRERHKTGVYFQDIPIDPIDEMAVWGHKQAEALGYFKIDFLTNHIYDKVKDESHLVRLLTTEPPWECFLDQAITDQLAQLRGWHEVVRAMQPRSIAELAVVLAVIRPGKRHLIGRPQHEIEREIWLPQTDKKKLFAYKRSHAIAYAASLIVQLNLLLERRNAT